MNSSLVARLGVVGLLVGLTHATLLAQEIAPSAKKKTSSRVRLGDKARMQALVIEGERLLKTKQATPIADLQKGLGRSVCQVKFAPPATSDLKPDELYRRARQSVVIISSLYYCNRCTRLHATVAGGVVVGTSGEVLTNEHVVRGRPEQKRETMVAMTAKGRVIPVREVLASSRRHDVAVIKLDTGNLPALPLGKNPLPGSPIRVLGHPNNHFFHFSDGIISRYFSEQGSDGRTDVMSITADFGRGSSGGPILDLAGNVVGIVSRTSSLYYRQTDGKQENLQMVFKLCVASSSIRTLVTKPGPEVVQALPTVKLAKVPAGTRGAVQKPETVDSAKRFAELVPDEKQAKDLGKRIDWDKQHVLVFRWSGSGQDRLEFTSDGKSPTKVEFVLRPGLTRDLRQHARLFVIARKARWTVVRGKPGKRPVTVTPVRPNKSPAGEGTAFQAIEKSLQVRRRGSLVFVRATEAGLGKLDDFLKAYPKSKQREEALYLRALTLWNLKRYAESAPAYRTLLDSFPKGRHTRLARIREAGALLFSDRAKPALERLDSLMIDYPDRPEMYGRERAHALVLLGRLKEAEEFMNHVESLMLTSGKERFVPRMQMQFAPLRMVGKPLKTFVVARHGGEGMIDSSKLKGQVVLLDFWATWCRPCMAEMSYLRTTHERFHDKGFQIVSISLDDDRERMETVVAREKMNWLHHFDGKKWKNEVAVLFGVHSIPMNLLVDRQGIVRSANLRGSAVARRVEELVKESAARTSP
ncbi:MAG: hypothetical protein CMJ65_10230 [Planctomycetaceae bacterium]|jgi:S1-C subfamily serine protease/peroxiredoxin|nr:hypothetical protein [Planctomycetaceae bacterium]MDP7277902.1 trypsin-like peptidase domain-containing protein [Planctomycetaceae bacterium]